MIFTSPIDKVHAHMNLHVVIYYLHYRWFSLRRDAHYFRASYRDILHNNNQPSDQAQCQRTRALRHMPWCTHSSDSVDDRFDRSWGCAWTARDPCPGSIRLYLRRRRTPSRRSRAMCWGTFPGLCETPRIYCRLYWSEAFPRLSWRFVSRVAPEVDFLFEKNCIFTV